MDSQTQDLVVVGAGAAGIFAAWRAASLGARVLLLEKTDRLGTKILISGGGKCNVAHDGPLEEVLKAFRPNEARWLRPACYRLPNTAIMEMMRAGGLEMMTRPDGRVFPVHQTAKDVVKILREYLNKAGVQLLMNSPVTGLISSTGGVLGVCCGDQEIRAAKTILSVGGSSYPASGTTGDGWPWAKSVGHTIIPVRAALAPVTLELEKPQVSGVALRDVLLRARQGGKEIARWRGDLLFTHHGLSGPTVLGITRVVAERIEAGPVTLSVDLLPDLSFEQVKDQILEQIEQHRARQTKAILTPYAPASLIPLICEASQVDDSVSLHSLEKKARNRLIETLKGWDQGRVKRVPIEKGECVAGGVHLDEVDPHSMRSSRIRNLYLCGEILDIAGPVGGYNLQAAFATGFVAGESAAQELFAERPELVKASELA